MTQRAITFERIDIFNVQLFFFKSIGSLVRLHANTNRFLVRNMKLGSTCSTEKLQLTRTLLTQKDVMGTVFILLPSTWQWHHALEKLFIHVDYLVGCVVEALSFEAFKIIILFRASQRKGFIPRNFENHSQKWLSYMQLVVNRYLELILANSPASSTQKFCLT